MNDNDNDNDNDNGNDNDNDNDNEIDLFRHHNGNNTNIKVTFKQVTMLDPYTQQVYMMPRGSYCNNKICRWHMTTSNYIIINKVLCCHFFMYRRSYEVIGRLFK